MRPKRAQRRPRHRLHLRLLRDVDVDATAASPMRAARAPRRREVAIGDHDARAFAGERRRDRGADARRGARDDRDAAFEPARPCQADLVQLAGSRC